MGAMPAGRSRLLPIVLLAAICLVGAVAEGPAAVGGCGEQRASPALTSRVLRVLSSGGDVWGNALLASRAGPTFAGARRYLPPLRLARAARGARLTKSGVYYLPFAQPLGVQGAGSVALHVADGSEILSQTVDGASLAIGVGRRGDERFGSCRGRSGPALLLAGYLPALETSYVDAEGVRYRQESFAARIDETSSLVSFVRITADARRAAGGARIRLTPSIAGLRLRGDRLQRGRAVAMLAGPGAVADGRGVAFAVPRGSVRTVVAAWLDRPAPVRPLSLDEAAYDAARRSVEDYWQRRLAEAATFVVPERRVLDAERNLLIQNLVLTWRYSIGNAYEEFSFPESVDAAQVMAEYGLGTVSRSMLRTSLTRRPTPYPNWKMGERLIGSALYFRLSGDRAYVRQVTPTLRGYVAALGRQLAGRDPGILGRERYSSDIPDSVYGLHSQTVAWQGLREMGRVWAATDQAALGRRSLTLAARLERGLRRAVRSSARRLPDGSLFMPVRLLDEERAYDRLTESRPASYWNLVMPYALASGFFEPGGPQARGVLHYLLSHGSRLLGLVRASAFALYGEPVPPVSGTDQVYGLNMARFLADNDQSDQLVLSLYGQLAAAMTPNTFVAGEGATVAPLDGAYDRAMYLPPNVASNAAFLETLRVMLVHETRTRAGAPDGLELAYATPRAWLTPGRRILVREAPTSFGPVSFAIEARTGSVQASVVVPSRARPRTLRLRLRLPAGTRIASVLLGGRPLRTFDARTQVVDLSGRTGTLELEVRTARR
jgi:hypothetical protein